MRWSTRSGAPGLRGLGYDRSARIYGVCDFFHLGFAGFVAVVRLGAGCGRGCIVLAALGDLWFTGSEPAGISGGHSWPEDLVVDRACRSGGVRLEPDLLGRYAPARPPLLLVVRHPAD